MVPTTEHIEDSAIVRTDQGIPVTPSIEKTEAMTLITDDTVLQETSDASSTSDKKFLLVTPGGTGRDTYCTSIEFVNSIQIFHSD